MTAKWAQQDWEDDGSPIEIGGVMITVPDLRRSYHTFRGMQPKLRDQQYESIRSRQLAADAEDQLVASMSRDTRRRFETSKALSLKEAEPDDLMYIHSVLALCGLPYREQHDVRSWTKEYGRSTLHLMAGKLKDPQSLKMVDQPLPYGPKARLLLIHICSEAIRTRSNEVEMADSMTAFIRDLGFPVTGGAKGTILPFKRQLHALAACQMQIGLYSGNKTSTLNAPPFRQIDVWLPENPDQKVLWPSKVTLDDIFFRTLKDHALPVDVRSLKAVQGSSRKIDLLFWLGYRTRNLENPIKLDWSMIQRQFGGDNAVMRSFRTEFKKDIGHILELYPTLRVDVSTAGMVIYPSTTGLVPAKRIATLPAPAKSKAAKPAEAKAPKRRTERRRVTK